MREGWEYKKLGEVCEFKRGLTYAGGDEVPTSDNCVLRSNNVNLETMALDLSELKYLRPDFNIPAEKKVKKNSILICMSNGSKQHIGKVAFIDKEMDYAFGGFMGLIIPDNDTYPKYIYFGCRSALFKKFLGGIGEGANIKNLRFQDLEKFALPLPLLAQQQSIVAELDKINEVIALKKVQLKDLDLLAQSIFYEMFGDPIENSKGWEVKKLGEVSTQKLSYGSGASATSYNGTIRYIRITDIDDNGDLKDEAVSPNVYDAKYELADGDILFARSGATVGKTFLYHKELGKCIYAGYLIKMVPDKEVVTPLYVYYFTKTKYYKDFISLSQNAVAQPNINAKQYGGLLICIPPLTLQQSFAEKIEAIETQKSVIKQSLAEAETLLASRMDYYFN